MVNECIEAYNGQEALDLLEQGATPDLIISDLRMPVMNGWQFIEKLEASPWKHIPVLIHQIFSWKPPSSGGDGKEKPFGENRCSASEPRTSRITGVFYP